MTALLDIKLENMDIGETTPSQQLPTLSKRLKLLTEAKTEITEALVNLTNQIDTAAVFPGLRRYYTTTLGHEVLLRLENFEHLLDALLEHANGNLKMVIVSLYEGLLASDAEEIASTYLECLYKKFKIQQNAVNENRPLYGRDEQVRILHGYMESDEYRVVNICGMAGIGKSHLVKWLVWQLESCTYADCSGSARCTDIVAKILEGMGYASADDEMDCRSSLLSLLAQRPDEKIVLVIDDIMPVATGSEKSEMAQLLQLILTILNSHRKVKIILTSQDLLKNKEYGEGREAAFIEKLDTCLIELPLGQLEKQADCIRVVAPDGQPLAPQVLTLIDKCFGHPFALSLLSTYLSMGEVDALLVTQMGQDAKLMFRELFKHLMKKLSSTDIDILQHLSMFPNQVTVRDLYGTYYSNQSGKATIAEFWQKLEQLAPYFVLDFLDNSTDLNIEKRVVKFHHPAVKSYFSNQLGETNQYGNTVLKFLQYHLTLIARMGESCITKPLKHISRQVISATPNITRALELLEKDAFCNIISNFLDNSRLVYLTVFFEVYHDSFARVMSGLFERLTTMMSRTTPMQPYYTHLCLLTTFISNKKQNFHTMHTLLSRKRVSDDTTLQFLFSYADGIYNINAPSCCDNKSKVIAGLEKLKFSRNLIKSIDHMSPNWLPAVKFYEKLNLLEVARGYERLSQITKDRPDERAKHLKRAIEYVQKAEEKMVKDRVHVLKINALMKKGHYVRNIANKEEQFERARQGYAEASSYYTQAVIELQRAKREFSKQVADIKHHHAILLRSHSTLLSEQDTITMEQFDVMITMLYQKKGCCSIRLAKEALQIYQNLGDDAMNQRMRAEVNIAKTYEILLVRHNRATEKQRNHYQKGALKHLINAYNIVKDNPRLCNLTANTSAFKELRDRLPLVMEWTGQPQQRIEKVSYNLQKILRDIERDTGDLSSLSGSEISNFDDSESGDNEQEIVSEHPLSTTNLTGVGSAGKRNLHLDQMLAGGQTEHVGQLKIRRLAN